MVDFVKRLKVQLLLPITFLFIIVTISSALLILKLQKQVLNFEEHSLLNSKVNKAVINFNELRTYANTEILAYIFTEDERFLISIVDLEKTRKIREKDLYQFLRSHPLFKDDIKKIQQSYTNTQALRRSIVEDIRQKNKTKALERFNVYTTLYDINSAQLIDIRNQLDIEISNNQLETKEFFKWIIISISCIIFFSSFIILFSYTLYQKNLIGPIRQLKDGLNKINRGFFPKIETMTSTSNEIDEILMNFNNTSATLKSVGEELLEANKEALSLAQIKSDFLSNMSHEIRTPLNSILGMSELLADYKHEEIVGKYISVIENNGKLLLNIVNDILDLSKLESGHIQLEESPCNLRLLINRLALSLEHTFSEKSLTFEVVFSPELPQFLLLDDFRLEQTLLNILNNARKFTDYGYVNLTVDIKVKENKEFIAFNIEDSGIGITKEDLSLLFERFTQADSGSTKKYEGTGLGLSIVKQLIELMDGEVNVESTIGKGSNFEVLIPLKPCAETELSTDFNPQVIDSNNLLQSSANLLLVDDAKENRFLARMFLQNLPITITEATNGFEAIEAYKNQSFDIVLMDIQMPLMDGLEATAKIRLYELESSLPAVPIIALSAYVQEKEIQASKTAGCNEHIGKPVQRDYLISTVINSLNQFKKT